MATNPAGRLGSGAAVLVLAPTGRDAAMSAQMLARFEMPCVVCQTPEDLIEGLRQGAGPAVLATEGIGAEEAKSLEEVLANQPAWSDPPLILLAGHGPLPRHLYHVVARRNTTLLHRPLKVATFATTIRAAVENRLRQYEVRDLLEDLKKRTRQLQRLTLELTETEERERERLAALLHDDLQQVLVGAKLHVVLLPKDEQIREAIAKISGLIDDAVAKSRSLSHELSPPMLRRHGLAAALEWLAERMHELHHLRVSIDIEPGADPQDDRVRTFLYRSAQELLFNVVKHAEISEACLRVALDRGKVVLRVQDRGRGLDLTAFEGESSGLGLLSIRERASFMGGRFEMHTNEGQGSSFTLSVPVNEPLCLSAPEEDAEVAASLSSALESRNGSSSARRLRILLADDHSVMRSGLRSLLEVEQDLEVVAEASDGAEAAELADQLHPDLILMDLSMPRMDGIEATQRIKARHPAIRVIGLSMFDDEHSATKMREAGAEGYIQKSVAAKNLLSAVRAGQA